MSSEFIIDSSVDQMLENLPIGSVKRALSNNLYGINLRQTGNPVPRPKDNYGYTFFTRPQLNLTTFNLSNYRGFYSLLTSITNSYQRHTRLTLDPRLGYGANPLKCPFTDPENVFIPIVTNNLISMSGFPDLTVPTYTSSAGLYGEEYGFVDGVTNHLEAYDIDVRLRNMRGNPLLYFFYIWIKYETLVFEGILNPYSDMITENEIDYNTRIYRLVMDQGKRFITNIGATGASYPINVPTGSIFDYNIDKPFNDSNNDITIRFRCYGFTPFDDIVKLEFNQSLAIFNSEIRALLKQDMEGSSTEATKREDPFKPYKSPTGAYTKIPYSLLSQTEGSITNNAGYSLNHKSYPYINLHTNELEWWVNSKDFNVALGL